MPNMIDTDDVAAHLQASGRNVAPMSVAKTLKREGIDPLFRKPGLGGQNVYDADKVFAVWPRIETTELPVFEVKGSTRTAQVDLVVAVTGVGPIEISGVGSRRQQPYQLHGVWTNSHDGAGWEAIITVTGTYVRKDGTPGGSTVNDYVWFKPGMVADFDEDKVPGWVVKWARENTPPSVTR